MTYVRMCDGCDSPIVASASYDPQRHSFRLALEAFRVGDGRREIRMDACSVDCAQAAFEKLLSRAAE